MIIIQVKTERFLVLYNIYVYCIMYSIILLLFFIAYLKAESECPSITSGGDRRNNTNSLRLVQYNVEWLFVDYYASSQCPGDGCSWHTTDDAKTHLSYVSDVIEYLQPDIINFCEIEGCDELNMLSVIDSSYRPYLKKGTDTATGQNVGMLTRIDPLVNLYRSEEKIAYPVAGSKCGATNVTGTTGVSKHYITEFAIADTKIAFIGAHLLAIPDEPSRCVQREGQAQVLQNIISSYVDKRYEIIVMGDMNDYDSEILDVNSNTPISRVLDILKGIEGDKKGKYKLTNVAYRIEQSQRYSEWYDSDNNCNTSSIEDFSMIDHILVTPNLDTIIQDAFIYHGYSEYCGKWNSDHFPVVIDFAFS
jgi:exonuclease III